MFFLIALALPATAQNLISSFKIENSKRETLAFKYKSVGATNPGTAAVEVRNGSKEFEILRDQNGVVTEVKHDGGKVRFVPAEEDWAKQDPKGFTVIFTKADDSEYRRTTYASLTVDGTPRVRFRSIYLGKPTTNENGKNIRAGDVTISELINPGNGIGIVYRGTEKDNSIIFTSRNTRIVYLDEESHKFIRVIEESRDSPDEPWLILSDVITESVKTGYPLQDIRKITNPDGEALTEEWEYYAQGEVSGPDGYTGAGGKVRRHKKPDGTETLHQYLKHSSIVETRSPGSPVERTTNSWEPDTKTRTAVKERGEREFFREIKKFEPTRTTTTTIQPGQKERVHIEDFYPSGKLFGGKTRRAIDPDGSISTYEYTKLPDGNIRLVEEHGKGDGEKVTEGTRETTLFTSKFHRLESKSEAFDLTAEKCETESADPIF